MKLPGLSRNSKEPQLPAVSPREARALALSTASYFDWPYAHCIAVKIRKKMMFIFIQLYFLPSNNFWPCTLFSKYMDEPAEMKLLCAGYPSFKHFTVIIIDT